LSVNRRSSRNQTITGGKTDMKLGQILKSAMYRYALTCSLDQSILQPGLSTRTHRRYTAPKPKESAGCSLPAFARSWTKRGASVCCASAM
jgi:hypothetical protein